MKTASYVGLFLGTLLMAAPGQADIQTQTITYKDGETPLSGYLAYDNAVQGQRPAVLVVHEWWGLNDYARRRAEMLAGLGYVALAVDMYGQGKTTEHPEQAGQWAKQITQNMAAWRSRAAAGLAALKQQPQTDPKRIAAIGYCFGGGTAQQLAYSGADLKGVVSFHGSLQNPPADAARQTKARFLICHGGADPMTPPEQLQTYLSAMEASGLDYQMVIYGGAKHAFTNPNADQHQMAALGYNAGADKRSWDHMRRFFNALFGAGASDR